MLRRFLPFSFNEDSPHNGTHRNGNGNGNGTAVHALAIAERKEDAAPRLSAASPATAPGGKSTETVTFEQVYQGAAVKPPKLIWGILKVADMLNSPHLSGMSPEAKRCSLLMALEAAGAEIEDILQDAVVRQRALNDYEDARRDTLKQFEAAKLEENRGIQAELDRLTSQYMSRIQANVNEVAAEQDRLHAWQKDKQQESQRITEAAAYCVPQGSVANGSSLSAVLERATISRR